MSHKMIPFYVTVLNPASANLEDLSSPSIAVYRYLVQRAAADGLGPPRLTEIAATLHVRPFIVARLMRQLRDKKLIEYEVLQ